MDRSKWIVIFLLFLIAAGVAAWSWVNFQHRPGYDPEQAHLFLEIFYARCDAAHSEEICDPVVGDWHRRCFQEQLEEVNTQPANGEGSVQYNVNAYLDCMNRGVDQILSASQR